MAETTRTTAGSVSPGASPPRRSGDLGARVLDDVKDMGTELVAAARDGAVMLLDEQRRRAAAEITAIGNVLHSSVKSLDEAGGPTVARYAEEAAQQIDGFAEKLRDSSWSELSAELEDFARRWPLAFIAAALGLGVIAGRILLAPPPRPAAPRPDGPVAAGEALPGRPGDGAASGEIPGGAPAGSGAPAAREGM